MYFIVIFLIELSITNAIACSEIKRIIHRHLNCVRMSSQHIIVPDYLKLVLLILSSQICQTFWIPNSDLTAMA